MLTLMDAEAGSEAGRRGHDTLVVSPPSAVAEPPYAS